MIDYLKELWHELYSPSCSPIIKVTGIVITTMAIVGIIYTFLKIFPPLKKIGIMIFNKLLKIKNTSYEIKKNYDFIRELNISMYNYSNNNNSMIRLYYFYAQKMDINTQSIQKAVMSLDYFKSSIYNRVVSYKNNIFNRVFNYKEYRQIIEDLKTLGMQYDELRRYLKILIKSYKKDGLLPQEDKDEIDDKIAEADNFYNNIIGSKIDKLNLIRIDP